MVKVIKVTGADSHRNGEEAPVASMGNQAEQCPYTCGQYGSRYGQLYLYSMGRGIGSQRQRCEPILVSRSVRLLPRERSHAIHSSFQCGHVVNVNL